LLFCLFVMGADLAWISLARRLYVRRSGMPFEKDTARIASRHRSSAAMSLPPESSSGQAIRHYYGFVQEQLTATFAEVPAASEPLWALGKAYVEFSREPDSLIVNGQGKALVFQGAAVAVDPTNWRAANELGVLLGKAGHWEDAAIALQKSLAVHPTPGGWHNLAVVCEHLGQKDQAEDARRRSVALGYRADQNYKPAVEWVSPAALGVTASAFNNEAAGSARSNDTAAAAPSRSTDEGPRPTTARRLLDWLPWRSAK
jgi:hypothetical protein